MGVAPDEVRWLSEDEQRSWRAYLSAWILLQDRLGHELQRAHGLTMADYEILVRLSEAPQQRLRMSELADQTLSSRSRLSHQVSRMEVADLVVRQMCAEDRRGAFAVLTDRGRRTLEQAAPTHVAGVRRHLLDQMSVTQFHELGTALSQVVAHLQSR